jgi:hypothetical protein
MNKAINAKNVRSVVVLNELFALLDCSLARYLVNARPWCRRPYLLLGALTRRLAVEHEYYAGEIARLLDRRKENVNSHTYPMEFTYYNDLSLEYLAPPLLDHQNHLIDAASAASGTLSDDREARRITDRLVKSLRKYGSLLAELLDPHRLAPLAEKPRPDAKTADPARTTAATRNGWQTESQTAA